MLSLPVYVAVSKKTGVCLSWFWLRFVTLFWGSKSDPFLLLRFCVGKKIQSGDAKSSGAGTRGSKYRWSGKKFLKEKKHQCLSDSDKVLKEKWFASAYSLFQIIQLCALSSPVKVTCLLHCWYTAPWQVCCSQSGKYSLMDWVITTA